MLSVWLSSEARGGIWLVRACSSAPWPFLSPPLSPGCCPTSRLAGWLGLPCILGSLGGILPAGSRGMQATRRPNEVVSLWRIVIPQFNHSCLRLHSQAFANASLRLQLCFWTRAAVTWLHQRCGFSFHYGCVIPSAEGGCLVSCRSLACVKFLYSASASRCLGLINGTFELWPRRPEWIPSCFFFPQGHSENSVWHYVLNIFGREVHHCVTRHHLFSRIISIPIYLRAINQCRITSL